MRALELLVVIEPFMSTTARLAHYILPPKLQFERPDATLFAETFGNYHVPFAQYTPAVATPPSEEVIDEWYVFWALGKRLGRPLRLRGKTLDGAAPPSTEEMLDLLTSDGRIPLADVRRHPCGKVYDLPTEYVQPAREDATGRFALCPHDVRDELAEVRAEQYEHGRYAGANGPFTHLLAVRRLREVMNTAFHDLPEARRHHPYNSASVHPGDLEAHGFADGERVMLVGEHGRIPAILRADPRQRRGVISMSHGWGALPEDEANYNEVGACTSLLVSADTDCEPINAMARMTALPVRFERC
jgi:anaerobic selenocysteine-containing dehydrogenase